MHVHVCLSSPILGAGWLRQAVREVALSRACQWGRVGLMRSSNRMNTGFTGNRKGKTKKKALSQHKIGDEGFCEALRDIK